jgi:hypothetical protein
VRDLHIFADLQEFRRFREAGGDGEAIFKGGDIRETLYGREVRDAYLHPGVNLNAEEMRVLRTRQRHSYSRAVYFVTPLEGL